MRASEARVPSTRAWLARLRARETDIKVKGTRPFHSSTVSPPKSRERQAREREYFKSGLRPSLSRACRELPTYFTSNLAFMARSDCSGEDTAPTHRLFSSMQPPRLNTR
ncbi:hypothetical protein EVAR_24795_1 [Eumeta japonica]|uniref:Uncharacterized protein n=1 Tax=Eumeta variegata TaxID=151549 RepID=A0A4C1W2V2_EUMVA|nr:hypothetical protein EVAR_24795_1 [Eumeta japonica]